MAARVTLRLLRTSIRQAANRINLVRPEIQPVIDVATALEPQQNIIEPRLPPAVKARIRALLRILDQKTRQIDRLQSRLNDRSERLEQIAGTLESIAQAIDVQTRAFRAAVSTIESVAESLSDVVDFIEETLNEIPLLDPLLGLLDDLGEFIDGAIQSFLEVTGIQSLIEDAIDALTQFDDLVDQLRDAAARALQLDRIAAAVQRVAKQLEDRLEEALRPIRELLSLLRGLALLKWLCEWFLVHVAKDVEEEKTRLENGEVDEQGTAERLRVLQLNLRAAMARHPVPIMTIDAFADMHHGEAKLGESVRSLRYGKTEIAVEQLDNALKRIRRASAVFPKTRRRKAYFDQLADLVGTTDLAA